MTRLVFCFCALWPLIASANFSELLIDDMSFSFVAPSGQTFAKEVQYEDEFGELLTFTPFEGIMNQTDLGIEINHNGRILIWPLLSNALSNVDAAVAKKLSATKRGGRFQGSFKKFSFKRNEKEYEATDGAFLCEGNTGTGVTREFEKMFNACVAGKTTIAINSVVIPENAEEKVDVIVPNNKVGTFVVPNKFNNFVVKIAANAFTVDFKTSSVGISMTGHMEGNLNYYPDQGVMVYKIITFTVGYFDLTEWLFKKVEESSGPTIRVERPFIFVTIDDRLIRRKS